jgi:hypothetical protein
MKPPTYGPGLWYCGYSTLRGGCDRCMWMNGGMVISRGKEKKLGGKPAQVPLRPQRISYEVTRDWTRGFTERSQLLTVWANMKALIPRNCMTGVVPFWFIAIFWGGWRTLMKQLTNSMDLSPFARSSATQIKKSRKFMERNVHYRIYKSLSLIPTQSLMNSHPPIRNLYNLF